ncbi:sybindin, putative [Theileria annulata]|uniref:Trafficking protein particle complex subunit n=1 Tax=Theileria annulata TaxID=5874 RepID=Q4U9B0_THEAN|nr:sybindin, putative [Theileria annulata]CAI76593.1 sybindin, putative [Theileria annulata]|eukprot:XP_953218.1 sybindin, putative [Theileria annulata]
MLSLFMINKHGCLIYYKCLSGNDTLNSNDIIRLASTLHGLSTISVKLCSNNNISIIPSPKGNSMKLIIFIGITNIDSDYFRLQCLETLTGLCIFMICDLNGPSKAHLNVMLNYIYELYSDYVHKCPFHKVDMPIRSKLFDEQIILYFKDFT